MTKKEFIKEMKNITERRGLGKLVDYSIDRFFDKKLFAIATIISNHVIYRYDFDERTDRVHCEFIKIYD